MEEKQMYCKLDFLTYNEFDNDQKLFLNDIENDIEISKYISNIALDIMKSNQKNNLLGYIVRDSNINEYIGVCVIKPSHYDLTAAPIEYAVHSKYRNTDKKYGRSILSNLCNILFMNKACSKIVLEIKENNIPSIRAAIHAGFEIDYGLVEIFHNEGYAYIPYAKNNPQYSSDRGYVKRLN